MMTAQYSAKLLALFTLLRAKVQYRAGKRVKPISLTANGLRLFASQLSLARRVSGFWGIIAIIKGLSALERKRPLSRTQLNLQRLQGISMLAFYPLDYLSFFSSPPAPLLRGVSATTSRKAQLWSVRAWGIFVGLQIACLMADWRDQTSKSIKEGEDGDYAAIKTRKRTIVYQLLANVSRLPVILNWSVVGGIYSNELWTDLLSFISAVAAFSAGWEATKQPLSAR